MEHFGALWPAIFPLGVACAQHVWQHYLSPSRNVVRVEQLVIYPIKSCGGISVNECAYDRLGLLNDRRWILVDEQSNMITMRQYPRMALIQPRLDAEGRLWVTAPSMEEIEIPPASDTSKPLKIKIWDDPVIVAVLTAECCDWFTRYLGRPARVAAVLPRDMHRRAIDPKYDVSDPALRINAALADGYPFLIFSQESIDELNTRLDDPVTAAHFRPNIVVRGARAYAEDTWRRIAIGDSEFDLVKACSRCTMTTIDPLLGTRHHGLQPLKTIRAYRGIEDDAFFGQNAMQVRAEGIVRVGDLVRVVQTQPSPFA